MVCNHMLSSPEGIRTLLEVLMFGLGWPEVVIIGIVTVLIFS